MPLFSDVWQFGKWMKENDIQTRYFEWNKCIYHRLEFLEKGSLPHGHAAKIEDCPGYLARYDYIGKQKDLIGKTALGHVRDGKFIVQVDQPSHPWSIGWHETPKNEWSLDI
jgi:hypothetical protein